MHDYFYRSHAEVATEETVVKLHQMLGPPIPSVRVDEVNVVDSVCFFSGSGTI